MKHPLCISPLFFASHRILSIDYLSDDEFYRYITVKMVLFMGMSHFVIIKTIL